MEPRTFPHQESRCSSPDPKDKELISAFMSELLQVQIETTFSPRPFLAFSLCQRQMCRDSRMET